MIDIIVQIMLEILFVLALTTTEIKQGRLSKQTPPPKFSFSRHPAEKFVKKIFRESKIETVLQKLAQLIEEETRMAAALTLQGVLESNTKAEINGTQHLHDRLLDVLSCSPVRQEDINKRHLVLAFPSRSIEKSHHCARTLSRRDNQVVCSGCL
jgi:hypothetical protein